MIISIAEARKILGREGKKYNDTQIEEVVRIFTVISDIAIDSFIAKTKEVKDG